MGELLLGVVNNVCTLYYPCVKTLNDSPTTVINVYRQYSMTTAPSSFCINNAASVLACLSRSRPSLPGLFHSTVKLFTIDTDSEPSVTFLIPEDRFLASPDT